jgi:hypothetical protein
MARWCAIFFATAGYLLVIWFYVVNPFEHGLKLLFLVCPACPIIETVGPTWPVYMLVFAPINAATFAIVGFLLGKLISVTRNNDQR